MTTNVRPVMEGTLDAENVVMGYKVVGDYKVVNDNTSDIVISMPDVSEERPYHHGNLRAALLDAAGRGLRERGADRLSLRDLAREVGVSHAAPRRHFPDRQALLDALAEAGFAQLDTALRSALADADADFPSRVRAAMAAYVRFATENAALLELMYAGKHRPGATRIVEAAQAPFGLMSGLIVQGQETGALQAGDPERIGIIVFATLQGIASLINGDLVKPELLDGLVETAVEQFVRGADPPK
ncbi:TetR/AcrR family transcriptional regulator [Actinomadura sp. LOL_016]|uniref:TetR/AcrR family transcriptional regulator n=1 Tax=unclassified Actinomadura TaxID=2626254 RepID=UPI003A8133C6